MPAVAGSFSIAITGRGRRGGGEGGGVREQGVCGDGELYLPACWGRINLGTTD